MAKRSPYNSKSIKTVLGKHQAEIYALIECSSQKQFSQLVNRVNEILDSKELEGNESVLKAKGIFRNCSSNYNRYLSTLMAYMTGMKVS